MNGDNTFKIPIMTVYRTAFVLATKLSSSEYKVALESSMYQLQKSSHTKLYSSFPTIANSYLSMFVDTWSNTSLKRAKIHLSTLLAFVMSSSGFVSPICI